MVIKSFLYMKGNVKNSNNKYDKRDKSNIINIGQQTGQCFKMRKGLKFCSVFMLQNKAGLKK